MKKMCIATLAGISVCCGGGWAADNTVPITETFGMASRGGDSVVRSPILLAQNKQKKTRFSLEKYYDIRHGMSYQEVVEIVGKQGYEMSSSEMPGVPGVMPYTRTVMIGWEFGAGANMNAMFQNGELISKAQFGLR
jgi:hypothetical protein